VLVGLATWLFTKHGFVRDYAFRDITFVALAAMILTIEWSSWQRRLALPIAGFCLCTLLVTADPLTDKLDGIVDQHADAPAAVWQVARLVTDDAADRAATLERHKSAVLSAYGLDPAVLDRVQGDVHLDPWDVSIVWAGNFRWRPVPVFQTYAAYGVELDHMNAEALRGDDRPSTVLRSGASIDRRVAIWESPEYQLAMTCNYDHAATAGIWQELYARPRDRCAQPVLLEEQTLRRGQAGKVPRPHSPTSLVAVRFDYPVSSFHAFMTTALRPLNLSEVRIDDTEYRFIAAVASQPHLLSVPTDAALPNAGLDIRSIEFPNADGPVVAHFYEIPIG
jgi:hypothetical protein